MMLKLFDTPHTDDAYLIALLEKNKFVLKHLEKVCSLYEGCR